MKSESAKRQRMASYIRLAQEWKQSGMSQKQFAEYKGLTYEALKYRVRKSKEMLSDSDLNNPSMNQSVTNLEFVPVPAEIRTGSDNVYTVEPANPDRPEIMIHWHDVRIQTCNQIHPNLLKTMLHPKGVPLGEVICHAE